jgi:hypothetical protein
MMRWLIAAYIVLVLVLSAKAGAKGERSSLVLDKLNYSSETP